MLNVIMRRLVSIAADCPGERREAARSPRYPIERSTSANICKTVCDVATPVNQPPRTGRATPRRDLHAASELLAATTERDAVTLRAIARRAGIAAPSIYPHFADRDAILDAVVEESFDRLHDALTAAIAGHESPVAELHAIARAYLQCAEQNPGRYRILFGRSQANLDVDQHGYPQGLAAFELLNSALQRGIDAGTSESTNARADSSSLWAALHGLVLLRPATPGFPWPDADDLVTRIVSGLAHLTPTSVTRPRPAGPETARR